MYQETITIPLYEQKFVLIQTNDFKKVEAEFDLTSTDGFNALVFKKNNRIHAVFNYEADASIVAHESVHICDYIFQDCFIKPDLENNEPYAYLMGWIVEKIHKHLIIKPIEKCN